MVAAQVHVEFVVAREVPAAALAVHDMHHGNVPQLHAAQVFRPGKNMEQAVTHLWNRHCHVTLTMLITLSGK